jgi:hypothetical protein
MDLSKGYWQTAHPTESRDYTAFITFRLLPLGQSTHGSERKRIYFQAQMASVIGSELLTRTEVYLDDILVYGDTPQEYLSNLKTLKTDQGVWCAAVSKKCSFRVPEVEYVTRNQ